MGIILASNNLSHGPVNTEDKLFCDTGLYAEETRIYSNYHYFINLD